jgi:hypothetical protein
MCFFISAAKVQFIALNISMKNMYVNNSGSYDFDTVYTKMTFKELRFVNLIKPKVMIVYETVSQAVKGLKERGFR